MTEFATRIAHHEKVTVFFSAHSIFYNSDSFRLLQRSYFILIHKGYLIAENLRNSQFICLLPQIREKSSIANLSRQIYAGSENPESLSQAFEAICARNKEGEDGAYLIVDLRASTPDTFRLRESFDIRAPLTSYELNYSPLKDGEEN